MPFRWIVRQINCYYVSLAWWRYWTSVSVLVMDYIPPLMTGHRSLFGVSRRDTLNKVYVYYVSTYLWVADHNQSQDGAGPGRPHKYTPRYSCV